MPTLHWIGKEKVVNHHQDVPYKILEHQYGFYAEKGKQEGVETGSGNKIIHGDNLEALKSLLPQYEGQVKCIYIDPPYNTGNEGWVYNDNVNDPKIKKWLNKVVGGEGEDLTRHDKWLCMMYPRLVLLHKLLSDEGFIFISIDYNAEHLLRTMLNEIFGISNFRNCISVRRGVKNVQSQFEELSALSVGHEYILFYSKNDKVKLPKLKKEFEVEKPGKWDTFWRGTDRPTMRYDLFGYTPPKGQWRWEDKRGYNAVDNYIKYLEEGSDISLDDYFLDHLTATNEKIDFVRKNSEGTIQYYVPPQGFKLLSDNWMDILLSGSYTNFVTEKNVLLIDRIMKWIVGNDKNSVILDSFAGSGTTAHAVLNLNKVDDGNRKFILIETEDYAETLTSERVKKVINENFTHNTKDSFFDFYALGKPLFKEDDNFNEDIPEDKIREYVFYSETKHPFNLNKLTKSIDNKYLLDKHNDTTYYFYYEKDSLTTLDNDFLGTVKTKSGQYIIYADNCLLDKAFMQKKNIIFKKIPRDITRF